MNSYPLVSIIVPTFNQAHYLPMALDSAMFQDYPNIEIIICNHGSTDNTSNIIENFLTEVTQAEVSFLKRCDHENKEDPFERHYELRYPQNRSITLVQSSENIGGTSSYNEGFKKAKGEFCTYLVGDDYLLPNAIGEMVDQLQKTGCDFVYADMFLVDDRGRILQHLKKPEYSFKACFADWYHLGVCKLYRKALHDSVGYYDPSYRNANDYDMYLRFAMAGASFRHINKPLYCVRKHDRDNVAEPASWRNNGYENLMRESVICSKRAQDFLDVFSGEKS